MDLNTLYRTVIMDNYKNPKNKGLKKTDDFHFVHLNNPSCGDDIIVEVEVKDGVITNIRHDEQGCLICCSSASVMSEVLVGKTLDEAKELLGGFFEMLMGEDVSELEDKLDEAMIYQGVSKYPARIKCATLPWKALEGALEGDE